MKKEKILLIDGMNTFVRSFTMIKLINSNGYHIGGTVGFLKSLGHIIDKERPTKVIIVFEGEKAHSKRRYLYSNYKRNRNLVNSNLGFYNSYDEMKESKENQLERLLDYLQLLPVTVINQDNLEADDIIAYLTNKYKQDENISKITIYSADQDFIQLVGDKVTIYSPIKKVYLTESSIKEKYNFYPKNHIIYKTLMGDSSDNIDGVSGLGKKKIFKLFPEITEDNKLEYEYIHKKALENKDQSIIYNRVLNLDHQLKINYKIMDLEKPLIEEDEAKQIEEKLETQKYKLRLKHFLELWKEDEFGRAIPNVGQWLVSKFSFLR